MKRNNTDTVQLSSGFRRMRMAGFFLHAAAYMPFPLLVVGWGHEAAYFYVAMLIGMFLSGPFNAYLGDACYRKSVFVCPLVILLAVLLGYAYADEFIEWMALAFLEGACLGLASAAGVTISIDVTVSGNRSRANVLYARWSRIGMAVGLLLGFWIYGIYSLNGLLYTAIAFGLLGVLEAWRVHVPFRAPIGVKLCNWDRFILPRAWLPAFNVWLLAFACGIFVSLLAYKGGEIWVYALLLVVASLLLSAVPLVRMFVRLSHHCQRGTSNTTLNLSIDAGMISGFAVASYLKASDVLLYVGVVAAVVSVLIFLIATSPYYKKKRVR